MKLIALIVLYAAAGQVLAQASLSQLPASAKTAELTFSLPDIEALRYDSTYRDGFQPTDLRWRHRGGDFELLARVIPETADASLAPHVLAGATVVHCSSNAEEDYVGRFRGGTEDLRRLNADWAYFWDYAPKPDFSPRRRCYQASYYRPGRGLVHVWLLYDDPAYLHSDWVYVLPFGDSDGSADTSPQ